MTARRAVVALGLGIWTLSGCAPLLIASGAVAGYAASRDSVTVDLDQPWERVWRVCREETQRMGRLKKEDPRKGRMDARIEKSDVVVTLKPLTESTVRVNIRARKNLLPKLDVAQRLGLAILRRADSPP